MLPSWLRLAKAFPSTSAGNGHRDSDNCDYYNCTTNSNNHNNDDNLDNLEEIYCSGIAGAVDGDGHADFFKDGGAEVSLATVGGLLKFVDIFEFEVAAMVAVEVVTVVVILVLVVNSADAVSISDGAAYIVDVTNSLSVTVVDVGGAGVCVAVGEVLRSSNNDYN